MHYGDIIIAPVITEKSSAVSSDGKTYVFKCNKDANKFQIKDAVEKRIDSQKATFDGYGPTQVALLSNAVIITKGNYLFYCTGKNADDTGEVFRNVVQ